MTKETPTPETDAHIKELQRNPEISGCNQTLDFARKLERERDEAREELQQWKMLCAWGGTPEHIDQFIKGQQSRIHQAQDIEETCQQLERERDEARDQLEREQMRLAACDVVAMSDTESSRGPARDMHKDYWSAAVESVIRRVDECIELRKQLEDMREVIEDVNKILLSIQRNDIFEETMRNHATCALAKLQPFIKP